MRIFKLILSIGLFVPAEVFADDAPVAPGVYVEIRDTEDPVKVGEVLSYLIRVQNVGPGNAINLRLTYVYSKHLLAVGAGETGSPVRRTLRTFPKYYSGEVEEYRANFTAVEKGTARFSIYYTYDQYPGEQVESEVTTILE